MEGADPRRVGRGRGWIRPSPKAEDAVRIRTSSQGPSKLSDGESTVLFPVAAPSGNMRTDDRAPESVGSNPTRPTREVP